MMNISKFRIGLPLTAVALAILTGCSSEQDLPDSPYADSDVFLKFNISVAHGPKGMTQATRANDTYFELPTEECENLNELRVIIVSGDTVEANRKINFRQDASALSSDLTFKTYPGGKRVYLFGNESSYPADYQTALAKANVGKLFTGADSWQLSRPTGKPLYDLTENPDNLYVPMSEAFNINVKQPTSQADLNQSADLFITRAVSKFSFRFRRSDDFEGTGNEKLTSIKINGIGQREYLIPFKTVYNPSKDEPSTNPLEGRYITSFAVPTSANTPAAFTYTMANPVAVASLPTVSSNSVFAWSPKMYLPETSGTEFFCTISYDGKEYLTPVKLPNLDLFPRNTHVIVDITIGNGNAMLVNVTPLPWDTETYSYDFTQNVGMATDGALSFAASTYRNLNKATGRLVLNDYPAAASGSFGISTPQGARWDAYLISKTGYQGAIMFQVTENGNTKLTDHISGTVDGTKANFKIQAAGAAGATANTAILQVIVTMPSGQSVWANVLQGGGYGAGVENLTIIQNPQ